jgi:outer membrane lipoprotein-sorting protein
MNLSFLSLHIGNELLVSQAFDVFGGLFPSRIGAAIVYTLATWRFRVRQLEGEILGVRRLEPYFHGVYRFVLSNGEAGQATSVQSRNALRGFSGGWVLLLTLSSMTVHAEEAPAAILEHARTVYAGLDSYADTGTVIYEYSPTAHDEHRFSTAFIRSPRHFLMDVRKGSGDRIVITGDPDAFHSWWKATGQVTEFPNPKNTGALMLNAFPTAAVSTKIPTLLYSKANLPGAFQNFVPGRNAGLESCGEQKCYRLEGTTSDLYGTGAEVNVRKLTVWIETGSYLVRKVTEEAPSAPGALNRTTTIFVPQADPKLADDAFQFTPPK